MTTIDGIQYMTDSEAKEAILEVGRRMFQRAYVVSNDGNISVKVGPDTIWVTPTGVSKGYMTEDMLVKMDLDGNVLEGQNKPSSEIKMHLRVFKENPMVMAVTHAHPPAASSFAIAGLQLDKAIMPEAVVNLGVVPVASFAMPGTQEVPDSIAPYCRTHNAVLLANHGALTWGGDIWQAYYRLESLEYYATVLMYTGNMIGRANLLTCSQVSRLLEVRESMGITAGGTPKCADDCKPEEPKKDLVPVGISARHVHLQHDHLEALFGKGYKLTPMKDLSQPGQYASEETVGLIGPKGRMDKVRILGPERKNTQVEITSADARTLGVAPVVRSSGDIQGTPGITIVGPMGSIDIECGVILADRHIHMSPEEAESYGVVNGQQVKVEIGGPRGGIMDNVTLRVHKDYRLDMHIDTDEANAFLIKQGDMVKILK